jgi:hypothetical protein
VVTMVYFFRAICLAALLCLLGVRPVSAQDTPPASPREFHDQEMQRLKSALDAPPPSVLLSTQADFDAVYYDITVDLRNYAGRAITGSVNMLARSLANDLNELILDLCGTLIVDSVLVDNVPRPYTRANNQITVSLPRVFVNGELLTTRIVYHGVPCQTNLYTSFSFYTRTVNNRSIPSIATLSEPYGSRDWWPCKDIVSDKADSVRVSMIVADTLTATSNGVLEAVTPVPPSSRRFTYVERIPISTYLVCASATNYAHFQQQYVTLAGDTMPVHLYPYPEYLTRAQTSWSPLPQMIGFYAGLFGEYPFVDEQYGMTMFNFSGGMEHQTNTSYGYGISGGGHDYDYILAHELSHQWWGDDVTCGTWPDIWLNEGFASYCEALWQEHLFGPQGLRDWELNYNACFDPSGPVYNPADLFSSNTVYNKGSWCLHMVRGVIRNDSLFFAGLRHYREHRQHGNATTPQFFADMSEVAGFDIEPYLHAYLYLTNRPTLRASFGSGYVDGRRQTVVRIRQMQTSPDTTFRTRLDLRFSAGIDTARIRVENSERKQRYYTSLPFAPTALTVDPDEWVLKNLIAEALPLTILNDHLDPGTVGEPYIDSLVSVAGSGSTRTWSIFAGSLPPGLSISAAGLIQGTPTTAGVYPVVVRVQDAASAFDTLTLALDVTAPLAPPHALSVFPIPGNQVRLLWHPVAGADSYAVYRANRADFLDLELVTTTADTFAIDPLDTSANIVKFYRVTAVRHP